MPHDPSRRLLLRGLVLAGATMALAGCDEAAGRLPPSPTAGVEPDDPQTWPPDTELLISARQRVHSFLLAAGAVAGATGRMRQLTRLWGTELSTLEQLITLGGVPLPELRRAPVTDAPADDEAASTSSSSSGSASGPGPDDSSSTSDEARKIKPLELGRALRRAVPDFVAEIASASPSNLALLTSLVAQQAASAELLGAPVDWSPLVAPEGAAAVPLLAAARPAIFGLEVVAARSRGEERAKYEQVLDGVRALTRHLTTLAGAAAPVAPLGYDLPGPLETAEQRLDLARALVADIAPAALGTVQRVRGQIDPLFGVVRVVTESVTWTRTLGATIAPFPGMTLPG